MDVEKITEILSNEVGWLFYFYLFTIFIINNFWN
jgi:hypothetical protein